MMMCNVCGGAVFAGGEATGYGGPICAYRGQHPPYGPITATYIKGLSEDDVRRIVREEFDRRSGNATAEHP